ncbi:MAG: aspartate ammonia-lyase [Candidatus Thermoplasmatota archaeon]|nr:aspartate ammonia-lyase [Candidatus Thermoplasmatota archaeon]
MADGKRIEIDPLGEREVPLEAYYGIQTLRAVENFPVSGLPNHPYLIDAYAAIKGSAALANIEVGWLDRNIGEAIVKAAEEVRQGGFRDHFPVDRFQAGAGTSTNMNVNEVIANRALEILGHPRGRYDIISPNDHVNMAQSTNDTFPTAMQISVYRMTAELVRVVRSLSAVLRGKGSEFADILKTGRTHLQDAMPVSLGGEFRAYGAALERVTESMEKRSLRLLDLPLGGTATGTGINTHPEYRENAISHLSRLTGLPLRSNPRSYEAMQSTTRIVSISSSYKELALELGRIANDLRLMSSGPTSGLAEISLPAVQPGSSIMPGKVNPVLPECLNQICFVVIGNDVAISQAAGAGQLELNVMMPMMGNLILRSAEYLVNFLPIFETRCVTGITVNENELDRRSMNNPALATLLSRRFGYLKAAEVAKESAASGRSVKELVVERGLLTVEEAEEMFSREALLGRLDRS